MLATSAGMFPLVTACMNWSFDIDMRLDRLDGVVVEAAAAEDADPVVVPAVVAVPAAVDAAPLAVPVAAEPEAPAAAPVAAVVGAAVVAAAAAPPVAGALDVGLVETAMVVCAGTVCEVVRPVPQSRRRSVLDPVSVTVIVLPPTFTETLSAWF